MLEVSDGFGKLEVHFVQVKGANAKMQFFGILFMDVREV